MPPVKPKISVIIVNYNTRQMTLDCLTALSEALEDIPAEIFVVDNASTDGSPAAIREAFPQVRVIENARNRGFGAANNQAMREASGEDYLLLNSDAFPKPGAIRALVAALERHPKAAGVGPRLLNADGSLQKSCYKFPSPARALWENLLLTAALPNHSVFGDYRAWAHDQEKAVDFVIGACFLVRAEAVASAGMFDEDFFLYAEETDWCRRFWKAGWEIWFTPDGEVTHLNGGSGKRQADRVFCEFRRGQERFFRKHHGVTGLWAHRACLTLGACLRIVSFGGMALLAPKRRAERLTVVEDWKRILLWTLGRRGPGLQELSAASQ